MEGSARHRLVVLPGGGERAPAGVAPRGRVSLRVIDGQAGAPSAPPPAPPLPADTSPDALRRFRRDLEARIARPLETLF